MPESHKLLADSPRMPTAVIAERIGWERSMTTQIQGAELRPLRVGVDPADRLVHRPGDTLQMDLRFPEPTVPVEFGQARMLPVLVMTLTLSRWLTAVILPSQQSGSYSPNSVRCRNSL